MALSASTPARAAAQFENGSLRIHEGADNVSEAAIERLKREIEDFDGLIRVSDGRTANGS